MTEAVTIIPGTRVINGRWVPERLCCVMPTRGMLKRRSLVGSDRQD
jgi:hypothetical protein